MVSRFIYLSVCVCLFIYILFMSVYKAFYQSLFIYLSLYLDIYSPISVGRQLTASRYLWNYIIITVVCLRCSLLVQGVSCCSFFLYICVLTLVCLPYKKEEKNSFIIFFSSSAELRALGLAFEELPPMSTVAAKGKDVTIPCRPIKTENGLANVTWIRDAMVVNDERRYMLPNGTLLIKTVRDSTHLYYESSPSCLVIHVILRKSFKLCYARHYRYASRSRRLHHSRYHVVHSNYTVYLSTTLIIQV